MSSHNETSHFIPAPHDADLINGASFAALRKGLSSLLSGVTKMQVTFTHLIVL